MLHIEQKSHATITNAPIHVVTQSARFRRSLARRLVKGELMETRGNELLHGAAAEGAVYELFDSMARDAADRRPRSK
jgi:hypothetical protein